MLIFFLQGDVAISSASFILLSSDLQSLLTLSALSRTVFNRVKFNFVSRLWISVQKNQIDVLC
jgi:Cu+-exporting ATPase